MPARKLAISLPEALADQVDRLAAAGGESRSGYIARVLAFVGAAATDADIKRRVNAFCEDPVVQAEQRELTRKMAHARSRVVW